MKALIIVDLQNDVCPGGALTVKAGNEIVDRQQDLLSAAIDRATDRGDTEGASALTNMLKQPDKPPNPPGLTGTSRAQSVSTTENTNKPHSN